MKRKVIMLMLSVAVAVSIVLVGCAPEAAPPAEEEEAPPAEEEEEAPPAAPEQEVFEWRTQSVWTGGSPSYEIFMNFVDRVEELTDGRIVMEVFPPAAIVPSLELLDGIGKGTLDAASSWPGWYAGKDPAFAACGGLPFSFDNDMQLDTWYYQLGGLDMMQELYEPFNCHVAGMTYYNVESWHANREIRTVEDLQGLKIRMPGGMLSDIFERVGCSVVLLAGEDVYPALERNLIDGTDWMTPADNYMYGFHEVAPYFDWPGWHHLPANEFMVNLDKWNELPDDLKAVLEAAVREWAWNRCTTLALADYEAVDAMVSEGATPLTWDPAEIVKMRNIALEVWDEWAAKSPMSARMIESQKEYNRLLGLME